jgi:6-phosphogluconolactonase
MSTWHYGLFVVDSRAELAALAAARIARAAEQAVSAGGHFSIALSGGSTPGDLFRLLAGPEWRDRLPWTRTLVFWGDERCVPPDDERSNYRLARETLLEHVPVPPDNVFRMRGELEDRQAAAEEYEAALGRHLRRDPHAIPRFDLLLQGLGSDGHTASLLPGSALVREQRRLVAVTDKEREGTIRLTVTPPILQHAGALLFLAAGADKAPALREILLGAEHVDRYPAQVVRHAEGKVAFLVDRAAAAELAEGETAR